MPSPAARQAAAVTARTWIGFSAMSVGMFLAILDTQIVASSLPAIEAGLFIGLDRLSWVQTAYLMAEVVAIPLTGWLTRVLSTRGAFLAGIAGFTLASIACARATSFWTLVAARIIQGFCGGLLIPLVFSAIFLMFPRPILTRATVLAGIMAMLAPTLGPSVGGFITDTYSWHWLFLINVAPGIAVALLVAWSVTIDRPHWRSFGSVDLWALPLLAVFLGTLQVLLKEAPERGWADPEMPLLAALCALAGGWTVRRCLTHPTPLIDLGAFRERNFALGCCLSFVFGIGLYGATYLLPVYLGVIRYYEAFDIGLAMMVTGATQLLMAPLSALLERRLDARLLIAAGFGIFAVGLVGNAFMTPATDFWGLFWQQIARGGAIMLCLLATTSLALGGFAAADVPNASGLFNLMRNLAAPSGLRSSIPCSSAARPSSSKPWSSDCWRAIPPLRASSACRSSASPACRSTSTTSIGRRATWSSRWCAAPASSLPSTTPGSSSAELRCSPWCWCRCCAPRRGSRPSVASAQVQAAVSNSPASDRPSSRSGSRRTAAGRHSL
jgi:DHA2 family multidrug resistance protein